jgi:dephospho-CoA kinase
MLKLGITGGIGCGKSAVARLLEAHGFRRLDSDQIVRERLLTGLFLWIRVRL